MSRVVIITTSLRARSNSDILAEKVAEGAKAAGHEVEVISLRDKTISFCRGCLACQKTLQCVIKDDAMEIAERVKEADTLVFATPIYYYEMSGQMKTLLDRLNPLYPSYYKFRNVYMLMTAAEDEAFVCEKAVSGLEGWIDCFGKANFKGSLFCGGINDMGEAAEKNEELKEAYEFGEKLA